MENKEFEQWWDAHGQYVRAGGGQYEISFAFAAWQHQSARIAELEAQTAHMADLVELANNATERADKLEAQAKQLQREPLSDGEIKNIIAGLEHSPWLNPHGFARAIEAAHNIK